jgi:selenocysteine lyase/cysteine desulfurase
MNYLLDKELKLMSQCLINDDLIKEEFPACSRGTWFATGIVGVMPKSAANMLADAAIRFETEFFYNYQELDSAVDKLRIRLASLISAENVTDICFTRNATEGIIIGVSNVEFNPGDEIVTSNQEHGALLDRLNYLERLGRAKLKMFEISKDPEETLESVKKQVTEKTKLLAFSHVSCQTGIRLPAKEICGIGRKVGAYVLIDGAQTVGDIEVNVRDYDCDFYIANGHKWLCGPKGTSFLYINPDSAIQMSPTFLAFGSSGDDLATRRNATRFEYGTREKILLFGLKSVLDLYDKWNWEMKDGRIKELSTYLRGRLKEVPKCIVHTPMDWDRSSGNTSFSVEGYTLEKIFVYLMNEWQIMIRNVPEVNSIRISTSYFNTYAEIDRLIEALKAL